MATPSLPFLLLSLSLFLCFSPTPLFFARRLFFIHSCPRRLLLKSDEIINSSVSCELSCTPRDMIESTRDIHQVRNHSACHEHSRSRYILRLFSYINIFHIPRCSNLCFLIFFEKNFQILEQGRTEFLLSIARIFIFIFSLQRKNIDEINFSFLFLKSFRIISIYRYGNKLIVYSIIVIYLLSLFPIKFFYQYE